MARRKIGIAPGAALAGSTDSPDPPTASRPTIPVAILSVRAQEWHAARLGHACECFERGVYPCPDCRHEILDLVELLDGVVRDTIRVVTTALERMP